MPKICNLYRVIFSEAFPREYHKTVVNAMNVICIRNFSFRTFDAGFIED
jgi:hypothetical protein